MPSYRKAIDAHCKSCSYDSESGLGTWRKQIEDCPCTTCSLFPVRPKTLPKRPNPELEEQCLSVSVGGDF